MKIRADLSRDRDARGAPLVVFRAQTRVGGEFQEVALSLECDEDGFMEAADWSGAMREVWEAMCRVHQIKELPGVATTPKPVPETEERGFV